MFCPNCGGQQPDNTQFCASCGTNMYGQAQRAQTSSGLQENVAGLLCYLFGFITGIIFLVLEPKNKTVRFHAFQSILFSVAYCVLSVAISIFNTGVAFVAPYPITYYSISNILYSMSGLFALLNTAINILCFVLVILLMVKAYQGQKWKLPIIGNMAEQWANKQ